MLMKKSLLTLFGIFATVFTAYATGDGTKENPYAVGDLKVARPGQFSDGWVRGYIIGWNAGASMSPDLKLGAAGATNNNIVLADTPDGSAATDIISCSNNYVPDVSIMDHPDIVGKLVVLHGKIMNTEYKNWALNMSGMSSADCYFIEEGGGTGTEGDGTEARPYTVMQMRAATGLDWGSEVWVEGYLVGAAANYGMSDVVFGKTGDAVKTYQSVVIADDKDCTDKNKAFCLAYAMEKPLLNIVDNPGQLGKKFAVKVTGLLDSDNDAAFETLDVKELSSSGISGIEASGNGTAEYFNLQGMPVGADNLRAGNIYILRQGTSVTKVLVK